MQQKPSPFHFYCGLFLLCFATLMLEIVQTRILSVVSWYYLAFFVIGLAMFGMTTGAVWVFLNPSWFQPERFFHNLAKYTLAFSWSAAWGLLFQLTLSPQNNGSLTAYFYWLELALCVSAPFFCSGVAVSLAVTRSPFPIGKVYAVDLAGASCGCFGIFALLWFTDAFSAVLWIAAIAALAAWVFSGAQPQKLAPFSLYSSILLALFAAVNGFTFHGLQPIYIKSQINQRDASLQYEDWNLFSRVALYHYPDRTDPLLWGQSPRLPDTYTVDQRHISIDGAAGTFMTHFDNGISKVDFLQYDLTNLAYHIRHSGKCAIIGVGGGRDVLSAWIFGFRDITGIELNPIFVELLCHHPFYSAYANLCSQPGIHFIADEARSWFSRHDDKFDLIQLSMIDTWASTSAGAFTLSENGLYTVEAFQTFLSRLSPTGILTVSRWYAPGEINETGRLVSLVIASLLELGIENPQQHLYLAQVNNNVCTLLVSRTPLSQIDIQTLDQTVIHYEFQRVFSPSNPSESEVLMHILNSKTRSGLEEYTSQLMLDLTPPTDNRPFFFNQLAIGNPVKWFQWISYEEQGGVIAGNLKATKALLSAIAVFLILVTAVIVIPLRSSLKHAGTALTVNGTCYFALLGFAFMMVEIGLLQRISLFLGHPTYSLCVVLFCIILSTGTGSYMSFILPFNTRWKVALWSIVLGGSLLCLPHWMAEWFNQYQSLNMMGRIGFAVAILFPLGFLMGFGFPNGLRMVETINQKPTPWFWGINGAAGVLATGIATAVSIAYGLHVTLWIGAISYLLTAIPAIRLIRFAKKIQDEASRFHPI